MRILTLALFMAAVATAQNADSTCGLADFCPKAGKCDGPCREVCDRVGEEVKAIRARTADLLKKETGQDCGHTRGTCTTAGCPPCAAAKQKVYGPLLKERVESRMGKTVKHGEAVCTFLTGPVCAVCVEEISTAAVPKILGLILEKVAPTVEQAKTIVVARMKQANLAPCECTATKVACERCEGLKKQVLYPLIRERIDSGAASHDGKPCTFLAGEACGPCADRLAEAAWTVIRQEKK